jgi:Zn-dependent protease with chaperone function
MNAIRHTLVLLAATLLPSAGVAAPPPPDLGQLLSREPMSAANWSRWSPRLREWSGEHYEAAVAAFREAFAFIKAACTGPGGRPRGMPRELERDAVAWMVLAGAYLDDPHPARGPVATARAADDAARQSIARDRRLARAHFWLSVALQREQLTPLAQGGPARPDRGRLRDALRELNEARALDPRAPWASAAAAGRLAVEAEQWPDAESFLRVALQENSNVETARLLARAISHGTGPFTAAVEPLLSQFPDDGVLVSHYAHALVREGRRDEAAAQLARARQLGTDPARVLDPREVRDLDGEQSRKSAEARRRQADEERHRAEADRRRAEEERRRAAEEARRRDEEAKRRAAEERRIAAANAPGFWGTVGWWAVVFTLFYGTIMGLMCLAGVLLARRTHGRHTTQLRDAPPPSRAAPGRVARTVHEMRLGRLYGIALGVALVLFYLSLPFVLLGLLLVFGCTLLLALVVNRNSQAADVHAALLRASGGGIGAVFQAVFARTGAGGYGLLKDREDCPRLFDAIDEVARGVQTEGPDEVWLSPGADFGVHQEGRGPFGMFGSRKRVLTLGLCVMDVLSVGELKSILAHEFAHFSHADTHWNRFLYQVTLSLRTAMREMARTGGALTYANPFYWFFFLYNKSYGLLSAGFSRSREFLADRMACTLYGSDVFCRALRKVCTDGTHFEWVIYHKIVTLLRQKKAYVNMYLAFRKARDQETTESQRRKLHKKWLQGEASLYASHPSFQERVDAARPLPAARKPEDASAMTLFEDPTAVERELTDFLTEVVNRYLRG